MMCEMLRETEATDIAERYREALAAVATRSRDSSLAQPYDLGRDALRLGLSIAELGELHHAVVHRLSGEGALPETAAVAVRDFFLEVIAVYDMALQGYRDSVSHLQAEVAARRRVEDRLRRASAELERQRDELDDQVRARTRELSDKAEDLMHTNRQLLHINREQTEFTYAISHDLKSPTNTLGMLLGELALGYREVLDDDGCDLLDMSAQTVERMGNLIVDLLNYSRSIESEFRPEPVDLGALLDELMADMRSDIADARIEVDGLPVILGSRLQLRMLFQNLISNALKFRSPDRAPVIRIRCDSEPGATLITVSDNGIGIAPENLDRIFGLFQRLHVRDEYPGTGLGLTLCSRIMTNHKGSIRARSTPGQGSAFELRFTKEHA